MLRSLALLLIGLCLAAPAFSASPATSIHSLSALPAAGRCTTQSQSVRSNAFPTPAAGCCKICHIGKACGNTCIAAEKVCHIGPGCACDG